MTIIIRNLLALLCSQVATWGLTAVLLILVPRYLGDSQFGAWSFAWSFVGFFGLVAGLGTGPFLVKEIARDTSRTGLYVVNALVLQTPIAVILAGTSVLVAYLLGYPAPTCALIAVAGFGMVLSTIGGLCVAGLQGEQRMVRTTAWGVIQRYASGAGLIGTLAAGKGLVVLGLSQTVTGLVGVVANGAMLWPRLRQGGRLDVRLWRVLLAGGFPFLIWSVALTVYGNVDVTMLSLMTNDAVVGWYALAYKLVGIPSFLPTVLMTVAFPALSAYAVRKDRDFAKLANRALRLVFFVTAPMAAGIGLVAADVITLLHYPAGFLHSIPLIRILTFHVPIVGLDTVMGAILMATDRQARWVVVGCLAAVLNPLLNVAAIPLASHYTADGAIGAAVVTVLTECFMLAGAMYLRPRGVLDRETAFFLARCAFACVPVVAAVLLVPHAWLPVKVLVGAAAYAVTSLALRTVSPVKLYRTGLQQLGPVFARGATSGSEA